MATAVAGPARDEPSVALRYGIAILVVLGALAIRGLLAPVLEERAPLLVFMVAPVAASMYGGLGPGVFATLLAALLGQMFFVPPIRSPLPPDLAEWVRLGLYVGEGLLFSWLVASRRAALIGLTREREDLVRTQAQLAVRERRVRETLEAAPSGMLLVDAQRRIVLVNSRAERQFGYSRAALLGLPIERLVPDAPLAMQAPSTAPERHATAADATAVRTLSGRRSDGSRFPIEVGINPVCSGDEPLVLASVLDISERRIAEARARASAERLALALEAGEMAFWEWYPDEDRIVWNGRQFRLTGSADGQRSVGAGGDERPPLLDTVHPDDRPALEATIGQALATGSDLRTEFRIRHRARGECWLAARGRLVARDDGDASAGSDRSGGGRMMIGLNWDITERRLREERLAQANRELGRLAVELEARVEQRTEALADANAQLQAFAHTVAHDLRAPLRNIQGFAAALLEDEAERLSEDGQTYVRRLHGGAMRLDQLITDLLAYSRLVRSALQPERVELDQVMQLVLKDLDADIAAAGARIDVAPGLPPVTGHRGTLVQVISNLLTNAIKFVAPGVVPQVAVSAGAEAGVVRLVVADNGIGIAPEHHERIFGVFERLHAQQQFPGTGIGLAIVQMGVERMGGRVHVDSTPGRGSRFTLELPAAG